MSTNYQSIQNMTQKDVYFLWRSLFPCVKDATIVEKNEDSVTCTLSYQTEEGIKEATFAFYADNPPTVSAFPFTMEIRHLYKQYMIANRHHSIWKDNPFVMAHSA